MPVAFAVDQVLTPLFVLPDVEPKWRYRTSKFETSSDFVPKLHYLHLRQRVGVNNNIIENWTVQFVKEKCFTRRGVKKIILVMNVYAFHILYKTLSLSRKNKIIVTSLPAHTSDVLQSLGMGSYSALKEDFHLLLRRRNMISINDLPNNILTISELLCQAYKKFVVVSNIVGRLDSTGLCTKQKYDVGPLEITAVHFTSPVISPQSVKSLLFNSWDTFHSEKQQIYYSANSNIPIVASSLLASIRIAHIQRRY